MPEYLSQFGGSLVRGLQKEINKTTEKVFILCKNASNRKEQGFCCVFISIQNYRKPRCRSSCDVYCCK